jgi:cation transport protein ChaC
VKANLDERELVSYAYVSRTLRVRIDDGFVSAYTFVANRRHAQYAGELGIERSAQLIMNARGVAGLNRDYLSNTVHRLEQEGFSDPQLRALLRCVEEQTAMIDIGGGI